MCPGVPAAPQDPERTCLRITPHYYFNPVRRGKRKKHQDDHLGASALSGYTAGAPGQLPGKLAAVPGCQHHLPQVAASTRLHLRVTRGLQRSSRCVCMTSCCPAQCLPWSNVKTLLFEPVRAKASKTLGDGWGGVPDRQPPPGSWQGPPTHPTRMPWPRPSGPAE